MTNIKHGSLEGCAVRWLGWEAWELGMDGTWREINAADAACKARVLSEDNFQRLFGQVPSLPRAAFRS
jgi:hypothetical protein